MYGEDRPRMKFIQGQPKKRKVDSQKCNLQFTERSLKQLVLFTQGRH